MDKGKSLPPLPYFMRPMAVDNISKKRIYILSLFNKMMHEEGIIAEPLNLTVSS